MWRTTHHTFRKKWTLWGKVRFLDFFYFERKKVKFFSSVLITFFFWYGRQFAFVDFVDTFRKNISTGWKSSHFCFWEETKKRKSYEKKHSRKDRKYTQPFRYSNSFLTVGRWDAVFNGDSIVCMCLFPVLNFGCCFEDYTTGLV